MNIVDDIDKCIRRSVMFYESFLFNFSIFKALLYFHFINYYVNYRLTYQKIFYTRENKAEIVANLGREKRKQKRERNRALKRNSWIQNRNRERKKEK